MKLLDEFTLFLNIFLLIVGGTNCQTTQSNAESDVLNLKALRVQFKELQAAFEELKFTDIANLEARDLELKGRIEHANSEIASLKVKDSAIESRINVLSGRVDSEISTLEKTPLLSLL